MSLLDGSADAFLDDDDDDADALSRSYALRDDLLSVSGDDNEDEDDTYDDDDDVSALDASCDKLNDGPLSCYQITDKAHEDIDRDQRAVEFRSSSCRSSRRFTPPSHGWGADGAVHRTA